MEVFATKVWDVNTLSFKFETQPVISTDTLNVTLAGVSTSAKQDTSNTSLASIDGKITAVNTSALALSATQTDRAQKTQLTDGTRDGTVKAASTLPLLTDTAVVTTQRDPLPAGTNLLGKVGIDQTTPGTTNAVAPITGQNGVQGGAGISTVITQRVALATDANTVTGVGGTFPVTHANLDVALSTLATQTTLALIKAKTDNIPADPAREAGVLATAANQTTGNTNLSSIDTKLTSPLTVVGNKTNKGAAPGTNNIGALAAVATAAPPSYTEGNLAALSTDLTGQLRISGSISAATSADVQNADDDVGYKDGDLGKNLVQTPDGRLRTLAGGVVNETPSSGLIAGTNISFSVTSDGRLRVSSAQANTYLEMFTGSDPFFEMPDSTSANNIWAVGRSSPRGDIF